MVVNDKFILQPSYYLLALLAVMHFGAVWILWQLAIPVFLIFILSILCLVNFIHSSQKYALLTHKRAVVYFWREMKGGWQLVDKTGKSERVELLENSVKTVFVTLLNFRSIKTRKKYTVIVMLDSLPKNIFRRLRVLLFAG